MSRSVPPTSSPATRPPRHPARAAQASIGDITQKPASVASNPSGFATGVSTSATSATARSTASSRQVRRDASAYAQVTSNDHATTPATTTPPSAGRTISSAV